MLKWLKRGALALLVLVALLALTVWLLVRGSVPRYDGELALAGLSAPVSVERDANGVVTIDAQNEADMARALGFVHGQERYFEMDLLRRVASGELSALFGARALETDRRNRVHRLRARVGAELHNIAAGRQDTLKAYTEGVNAGREALAVRPWPYLLLGQKPQPWTEADTALAGYAMFFDLQDEANSRELAVWHIRKTLPAPLAALLFRDGTAWDAPLFGTARGDATLPDAQTLDLRQLPAPTESVSTAQAEPAAPGSNNFAAGAIATADDRAIVADDMHLGLRAPSLWFRARLRYADANAPEGRVDVSGVSLPGIPGIIVGSNTHVAWGFTNSYGDWLDFFRVDFVDATETRYRTPEGEEAVVVHREQIDVAGGAPEMLEVRETRWGPITADESDGSALALRWTAQLPGSLNFGLLDLARAGSLEDALTAARGAGVPAQNLLVGDRQGRIAWRLIGRMPLRVGGCDPQAPMRPLDGCDWAGWRPTTLLPQPEIIDPPSGRLWSANARIADGELLALIGDSGYALGARQKQIADHMNAPGPINEARLLALQLDDRALFLERWNQLLRRTAEPGSSAEWKDISDAANDWSGRASVDSSGYRITRAFRLEVIGRVRDGLLGPAKVALGAAFVMPDLPQLEGVVWPMLEQRPLHLLPPRFSSWDDLLADAATSAAKAIRGDRPGPLSDRTWGEANTARICHPLAGAIPVLGNSLCMAATALPGDAQMPRVQSPSFGASQRMVVSPGREAEGYFQLPGGQVGNPLSPFWGAGHTDWVEGRPAPFLPGPAQARLQLRP